jgi:cytochrome c-type biogenesis protein CcmH
MRRPERPRRLPAAILGLILPAGAALAQEAHPPPAPGGAAGSSEAVAAVAARLLCMCGTCVNQTLHECTCGTAARERGEIAQALASGKSPEAVVEQYIEEFGLQVLTTPDKKGLNLVGFLVPFAAAATGLLALAFVLRGWARRLVPAPAGAAALPDDPADRAYRERIEKELRELES